MRQEVRFARLVPVASTWSPRVPRRSSITPTRTGRGEIRLATGGRGVDAAVNTARGGAKSAREAVRDGGRLATITSDPPDPDRGIAVDSVYVRPDATQLESATQDLGAGRLSFTIGASFPLEQAAAALRRASAGLGGAIVLDV